MMRSNLLLFGAIILWGIWGVANKFAVTRAHPFSVQWMFSVPLVLSLPIFFWLGLRVAPGTNTDSHALMWAVVAGSTSILATLLFFFALQDRPASIAVAITSAYPLVTLLLGVIAGTESINPVKIAGIILLFAGLALLQFGG